MSEGGSAIEKPIARLTIVGVGLIGGSLARALRGAGACREVVGYGRRVAPLERAVDLGVIDWFETDIAAAVQGAEIVVVCVPLGAMEGIFRAMPRQVAEHTILTDAGSAKGAVIEAARAAFGEIPSSFVPGHPIAGTEKSGVEASFAELYQNRRVILTPTSTTDPHAVERVRWMWEQTGAEVVNMEADHHDRVLAATSHLPHMLAYTLVHTLAQMNEREEIFRFAAGGFRDFTRIASSDPQMWHDICLANRAELLTSLDRYMAELSHLTELIRQRDGEQIRQIFARAKETRDGFSNWLG